MSLAHDIHLSRINDSVSSDTRMRRIFLCVRKLLIQSRIAEIEMHNALELARTSYDVVVSAKMSRLLLWHESTIRMLEARYETLGAFATMTYEKAATTYESYRCRTATLPSLLDLRKTWEEVNIYSIKTTFLWEFFSWTAADYIKMCQKIYEVQFPICESGATMECRGWLDSVEILPTLEIWRLDLDFEDATPPYDSPSLDKITAVQQYHHFDPPFPLPIISF